VESVQSLHLARLRQPHYSLSFRMFDVLFQLNPLSALLDPDDTSQSYSSFTTNYQPPKDYENLLIAASKVRSQGAKSFGRRESMETALVQSGFALQAYARYLAYERRAKNPDPFVMGAVYERAIAEAAKRRFTGEAGAEEALRAFWTGYCDILVCPLYTLLNTRITQSRFQRITEAGEDLEFITLKRAVRSVPGSGEVWARYIRFLVRHKVCQFRYLHWAIGTHGRLSGCAGRPRNNLRRVFYILRVIHIYLDKIRTQTYSPKPSVQTCFKLM